MPVILVQEKWDAQILSSKKANSVMMAIQQMATVVAMRVLEKVHLFAKGHLQLAPFKMKMEMVLVMRMTTALRLQMQTKPTLTDGAHSARDKYSDSPKCKAP